MLRKIWKISRVCLSKNQNSFIEMNKELYWKQRNRRNFLIETMIFSLFDCVHRTNTHTDTQTHSHIHTHTPWFFLVNSSFDSHALQFASIRHPVDKNWTKPREFWIFSFESLNNLMSVLIYRKRSSHLALSVCCVYANKYKYTLINMKEQTIMDWKNIFKRESFDYD